MMKRLRKFFEERARAVAQASPAGETSGSLKLAPPRVAASIMKDRTAEGGDFKKTSAADTYHGAAGKGSRGSGGLGAGSL